MDNFLRHYTRILSNVIKRSVEIGYFKTTAERSQFQLPKLCDTRFHRSFGYGIVTTVIAMIFIQHKRRNKNERTTAASQDC
jgi:hypothetical protein